MTSMENSTAEGTQNRTWLRFLWGAIPVVLLLIIIMILSRCIGEKNDALEARKKGLQVLQGMQIATKDIDRVVKILVASEDHGEAGKKLTSELNLSSDQALAIIHMPLSSLLKYERNNLDKQIARFKKDIAENKIEMEPEAPDVNVVALEMKPMPIRDRINLPGIVEPWVKYNILAEVRGEIKQKQIEKGTPVNAGDIIAVLDTSDYEIALQAAKASYDTSLANMNRLKTLYNEQLASRSQLDDITAQMERYKAELDSAMLNLRRCTIRSPITGIINDLYFEKGQYINITDPVAEVMQMNKVKVSVGIPESDVNAVRHVEEFEVKFDALDGKTFSAKKHFLSRASDPSARLYKLELAIDNPEGEILPDMFARVEIVKQEIDEVLAVPLYSIITLNETQVVYVVSDRVVYLREIKTGMQEGWRIQVTEGLSDGDQVIVVGHRSVSDGQHVNVVRTITRIEELTQ